MAIKILHDQEIHWSAEGMLKYPISASQLTVVKQVFTNVQKLN